MGHETHRHALEATRFTAVKRTLRAIGRVPAFWFRTLADLRERLTDEGRSNAESLGHQSSENGLEYRQRPDLPRLDEHSVPRTTIPRARATLRPRRSSMRSRSA